MKKLLLISGLVLLFLQPGKSQVFAPVGAKWHLSHVNSFGPLPIVDTAYVSESLMDTIIDGFSCRKVSIICLCSDAANMYVYDSNDTVYRYNFDLNRFTVLYNFNLNGGDSMYVVANGVSNVDSILVHIDSTNYITINSQQRKIQYGYGVNLNSALEFIGPFVEGVGSLKSIIPQINVCDPMAGPLRCYEDTILGLYNTGYRTSCDSLYVLYTSVNEIAGEQNKVSVYPNPFSQSATLTINAAHIAQGYLEIRNTLGEIVRSPQYFSGNKIQLERNYLRSGIYFYRIITNGNEFINGKFIIH